MGERSYLTDEEIEAELKNLRDCLPKNSAPASVIPVVRTEEDYRENFERDLPGLGRYFDQLTPLINKSEAEWFG